MLVRTSLNINKKCFKSCELYMIMRSLYAMCTPHSYHEQANCVYLLLAFEANLGCFQNASHYPVVDYVINVEALHPFSIHSLRTMSFDYVHQPHPDFPRYSLLCLFVFLPKSR